MGYFNLRGWGGLAAYVDQWEPGDGPCRVLTGMQRSSHDELRDVLSVGFAGYQHQVGLADGVRVHPGMPGAVYEDPRIFAAGHPRLANQRSLVYAL